MFDAQKIYLFQDFFNIDMPVEEKLDLVDIFIEKEFSLNFDIDRKTMFHFDQDRENNKLQEIFIILSNIETKIRYNQEELMIDQSSFIFANSKLLNKQTFTPHGELFYFVCNKISEKI